MLSRYKTRVFRRVGDTATVAFRRRRTRTARSQPSRVLLVPLLVLDRAKASWRLAISLDHLDFHPFRSAVTMTISKPEAACVYAALVLIDDEIDVTVNIYEKCVSPTGTFGASTSTVVDFRTPTTVRVVSSVPCVYSNVYSRLVVMTSVIAPSRRQHSATRVIRSRTDLVVPYAPANACVDDRHSYVLFPRYHPIRPHRFVDYCNLTYDIHRLWCRYYVHTCRLLIHSIAVKS